MTFREVVRAVQHAAGVHKASIGARNGYSNAVFLRLSNIIFERPTAIRAPKFLGFLQSSFHALIPFTLLAAFSTPEVIHLHIVFNYRCWWTPSVVVRSYLRWILGTSAVSRNVLRRGTPIPPRIETPYRSSPLMSAPAAFSVTYPVNEPIAKSERLAILQMPPTDPTRRMHLWLGVRATPFSLVVLLASLCGTPR